ncbi:hypothetical protein Pelo_14516 [Pelomyxa schiedti]|nr:hypothetical protein Pelo_14516 [Pelomyxa schiedti]
MGVSTSDLMRDKMKQQQQQRSARGKAAASRSRADDDDYEDQQQEGAASSSSPDDAPSTYRRWMALRSDGTAMFYTRAAARAAMRVQPSENTRSFMGFQAFLWGGYVGYSASAAAVQAMWQRAWVSQPKAMALGFPVIGVSMLLCAGAGEALATPCVCAGLRASAATMWALRGLTRDLAEARVRARARRLRLQRKELKEKRRRQEQGQEGGEEQQQVAKRHVHFLVLFGQDEFSWDLYAKQKWTLHPGTKPKVYEMC